MSREDWSAPSCCHERLIEQARRIQTSSTDSVPEATDRDDVTRSYQAVLAAREAAERSAS